MKAVWRCSTTHFITKAIHTELRYIRIQCIEHLKRTHRWVHPLNQYIDRSPNTRIQQDVSTSWGMGGGSGKLQYWWQVSWVNLDPEIHNRINNRKKKDPAKLYINKLELAALVVNFFAALAALNNNHIEFAWQPVFECGGDNTSANCWYPKFSTANKFAVGLTKILAMGQNT